MLRELVSMLNNPSSTSTDEKIVSYLTSRSCSTSSSTSIALFQPILLP
jgi:hypothetical protein